MEDEKTLWEGWNTVGKIGTGSSGTVYEIERDVLGRIERAALKVISIPKNKSEIDKLLSEGMTVENIKARYYDCLREIVREYTVMAELKEHANIVRCDDIRYVAHEDGIGWTVYIRMEYLTPLTQAFGQYITMRDIIKMGIDICSALAVCREKNIIHRNIKPGNIFVSEDGSYKLGDFGIVGALGKAVNGRERGAYKYVAPEVYEGKAYTASADLYSLGLVLYWMLNERRTPFLPMPPEVPTLDEEESAVKMRLSGEPLPQPAHGSNYVKSIIMKACAFRPSDRYADPLVMKTELLTYLEKTKAPTEPEDKSATVISKPVKREDGGGRTQKFTPVKDTGNATIEFDASSADESLLHSLQKSKNDKNKNKKMIIILSSVTVALIAVIIIIVVLVKGTVGSYGKNEETETETSVVGDEWSEWSDKLPEDTAGLTVEEKTVYRSRTKETTTAKTATLEGWEQDGKVENDEYGEWSKWSTDKPEDNKEAKREIETKKCYREKTLEVKTEISGSKDGWTEKTEYSAWSDWTDKKLQKSDTLDVESKTQYKTNSKIVSVNPALNGKTPDSVIESGDWTTAPLSETEWNVEKRIVSFCIGHYCDGSTAKASEFNGGTYHSLGNFTKEELSAEFDYDDSTGVYRVKDGSAVNQECGCNTYFNIEGKNTIEYKGYKYVYTSAATDWTFDKPQASDGVTVEERTVYRSRSIIKKYTKWSDYSEWGTEEITEKSDGSNKVESATCYRYRDKLDGDAYKFYRWTVWSDYGDKEIKADDKTEVEKKVMYRYKKK